ncbi:MAG: hypothetical protein ABI865_10185, partial [Nitrosospira sp.]
KGIAAAGAAPSTGWKTACMRFSPGKRRDNVGNLHSLAVGLPIVTIASVSKSVTECGRSGCELGDHL